MSNPIEQASQSIRNAVTPDTPFETIGGEYGVNYKFEVNGLLVLVVPERDEMDNETFRFRADHPGAPVFPPDANAEAVWHMFADRAVADREAAETDFLSMLHE